MKKVVFLMLMLTASSSIFAASETIDLKNSSTMMLKQGTNDVKNAAKSDSADKSQSLKPLKVKKIYV